MLLINLKKWNALNAKQRKFLQQQALNLEGRNDFWKAYAQEEIKRQAAAGIKTISFDAATSRAYVAQAYDVAWAAHIQDQPAARAGDAEALHQEVAA